MAFELPDWFNVDDYESLTISAKVGTQLLVDFWGESLEQSLKKGRLVVNCPWVIESVFPFANYGTSEIKYTTEMEIIPEKLENTTETAKYLAIGSCRDPDEVRREYLFYIYSITFNPVNPEDGKVVFTCRQPEPTPTPTVTPLPTEVPDETPAALQEITPAEPMANTSVNEVRQTRS